MPDWRFHAAWNLSPALDEIVYPAAGYDLLVTGRIRTSPDHPHSESAIGIAASLQGVRLETAPVRIGRLDSFGTVFDFVHHNNRVPRWMIFIRA